MPMRLDFIHQIKVSIKHWLFLLRFNDDSWQWLTFWDHPVHLVYRPTTY